MTDSEIGKADSEGLFIKTMKNMPEAKDEFLAEAWQNKADTAKRVGLTLGASAVAGKLFSMMIPARGPAAMMAGVIFTIPLVTREYWRWQGAYKQAETPGADLDAIAKGLAKGTVQSTTDLGLGFVGGTIGAGVGRNIATSETALGRFSQSAQRKVLAAENQTLVGLRNLPDLLTTKPAGQSSMTLGLTPETTAATSAWFARPNSLMATRIAQLAPDGTQPPQRFKVTGSAHGHSNLSDGTGSTRKNLQDARDAGHDFYAITDHNHLAARDGIKSGDPRHGDQVDIPILASNPKAYKEQFRDATAVSKDGEFVGLIGLEMGTIGKVGAGQKQNLGAQFMRDVDGNMTTQMRITQPDGRIESHVYKLDPEQSAAVERAQVSGNGRYAQKASSVDDGITAPAEDGIISARDQLNEPALTPEQQAIAGATARDKSHQGGVNHINLYDVPTFFEAVRQPRKQTFAEILANPFRRVLGRKSDELVAPDVVKYNDGDYKAMVAHLDTMTDTTGGRPVIQLNHPRFKADWDSDLPVSVRGRDYGIKSFDNIQQWRDQFGKYATQIEIITGQAMNPKPTDVMRTTDLGPVNLAGYVDKGLHVSPTFGRDDHFNLPGGRPAGTNLYVTELTKKGVLDAMRERRTVATTSTEKLGGHLTVNDRHFMGDILDQSAVPDLNFKMQIDGVVLPEAKYRVSLYGDRKVGDGRLAKPVQVRELTGQDILDTNGTVAFDKVEHVLGNKSAHYVEVQRTDPVTANVDYLWTAPIWVEPVATHSTLMRGFIGAASDTISPF